MLRILRTLLQQTRTPVCLRSPLAPLPRAVVPIQSIGLKLLERTPFYTPPTTPPTAPPVLHQMR
jgi:hypothetical protein